MKCKECSSTQVVLREGAISRRVTPNDVRATPKGGCGGSCACVAARAAAHNPNEGKVNEGVSPNEVRLIEGVTLMR